MDRYFTSVTLARWAIEHKLTIVGTMKLDRKGIPKDCKNTVGHDPKFTLFIHAQDPGDEKIMLVSFMDKKKDWDEKRCLSHHHA